MRAFCKNMSHYVSLRISGYIYFLHFSQKLLICFFQFCNKSYNKISVLTFLTPLNSALINLFVKPGMPTPCYNNLSTSVVVAVLNNIFKYLL